MAGRTDKEEDMKAVMKQGHQKTVGTLSPLRAEWKALTLGIQAQLKAHGGPRMSVVQHVPSTHGTLGSIPSTRAGESCSGQLFQL